LTPEHYQFFLYQLLRGLKYIHTGNWFVFTWICFFIFE
jgi:mitogen-activated protein kinase 1/3